MFTGFVRNGNSPTNALPATQPRSSAKATLRRNSAARAERPAPTGPADKSRGCERVLSSLPKIFSPQSSTCLPVGRFEIRSHLQKDAATNTVAAAPGPKNFDAWMQDMPFRLLLCEAGLRCEARVAE